MPDEDPPHSRPLADRAWPALPLALVAVTVVAALIGVLAAPEPKDEERIGDTVDAFAQAVQERRGERACDHLTAAAQAAVAARIGTLDCATTVRSFGYGLDGAALRAARLVTVQISGDRATIPPTGLVAPDGQLLGRTVTLERTRGTWRIASAT